MPDTNPWGLAPQQENVVRLMVEGKTYKEIGLELGVTASTIRTHVHKIMVKTGAGGGVQLTARWYAEVVLPEQRRSAYRRGYVDGHRAALAKQDLP